MADIKAIGRALAALASTALLLYVVRGEADEIGVHLVSEHFLTDTEFNEENYGLYYKRHISDHLFTAIGGYKNSIDRLSLYAGIGAETKGVIGAGVIAGLLTGYDFGVPVGAAPYVYADFDGVRLTATAIPVAEDGALTGAALGFSVGYRF